MNSARNRSTPDSARDRNGCCPPSGSFPLSLIAILVPVVFVVAILITAIIMIFVIPQFKDLFSSFGADLPAFTLMVVNMSDFVAA